MKRTGRKAGRFIKSVLAAALFIIMMLTGCVYGASEMQQDALRMDTQKLELTERSDALQDSTQKTRSGAGKSQIYDDDSDDEASDDSDDSKASGDSKASNDSKASGRIRVEEDEEYSTKEEVALYIHLFEHLPDNYITKNEAKKLGWVSSKGNLWKVAPGKSIGGDTFGNREELLPDKKGRKYYECDIDYDGGTRGAKRIVFSNDGLVYYTEDHYNTFELLYGEE